MPKLNLELVFGAKIYRWEIIGVKRTDAKGRSAVLCRCSCGTEKSVNVSSLLRGLSKSCGCLRKEVVGAAHTTHGLSNTYLYDFWVNIKKRCYDTKYKSYKNYGGRGITIYAEWVTDVTKFEHYVTTNLGQRPSPKHSLDRTNNLLGYIPGNLRWATPSEQIQNRRCSVIIEFNGETKPLAAWAKQLGIRHGTLYQRIHKYKWPLEKALRSTYGKSRWH